MMKNIVLTIIFLIFILFNSCQQNEISNPYKNEVTYSYIPGAINNQYEWLGETHNLIVYHFAQFDTALVIADEPRILMDSICSYAKTLYNDSMLNCFIDYLKPQFIGLIDEGQFPELIPGDSDSHLDFFDTYNLSIEYRLAHYKIDSINQLETSIQRINGLSVFGRAIDTMSISCDEKKILKIQVYLARYSSNFWEQYNLPNSSKIRLNPKDNIGILCTSTEALNKDLMEHDAEGFRNSLKSFSAGWGILTGLGIEGVTAAAIEGAWTSLKRLREIQKNGWYQPA